MCQARRPIASYDRAVESCSSLSAIVAIFMYSCLCTGAAIFLFLQGEEPPRTTHDGELDAALPVSGAKQVNPRAVASCVEFTATRFDKNPWRLVFRRKGRVNAVGFDGKAETTPPGDVTETLTGSRPSVGSPRTFSAM